jgi:hypothetical protein
MESVAPPVSAPIEHGWKKLILALLAFFLIPAIPQVRALIPVDQPFILFVTGLAACALVGWWAGGRAVIAIVWVALAGLVVAAVGANITPYENLVRGWSLLLAGAFGLVSLAAAGRAFFPRAMTALCLALGLAVVMSLVGPVKPSAAQRAVAEEFGRRNAETMGILTGFVNDHPKEWEELTAKLPDLKEVPAETQKQLEAISKAGVVAFPALLALESLAALGLAWATYHRVGRARLGAPLTALREFRFNDQLVWGLIVGLVMLVLPTLATIRSLGSNLIVFFGALYAVRGFAVLAWFFAPGALTLTLAIGFAMLWAPVLNVVAALGFMVLGLTALGLGLGDTWADWRSRARSTPSQP